MTKGKVIVVISILIVLILVIGIFYFGRKPAPPKKITLEFWGVYDDSDIIEPFIKCLGIWKRAGYFLYSQYLAS